MEFHPPRFPIRMSVFSSAIIYEDNEDGVDKEGGDTTSETGQVELEPRCASRLVDDLVTVRLLLRGLLVCWLTFGSSQDFAWFTRSLLAADLVMGPLGCCKQVGPG